MWFRNLFGYNALTVTGGNFTSSRLSILIICCNSLRLTLTIIPHFQWRILNPGFEIEACHTETVVVVNPCSIEITLIISCNMVIQNPWFRTFFIGNSIFSLLLFFLYNLPFSKNKNATISPYDVCFLLNDFWMSLVPETNKICSLCI